LKQTHKHGPIHISFYMFILYLVKTSDAKTSDASECKLRRRPLPVRLLIEPECRTFFKSLFKLLTF